MARRGTSDVPLLIFNFQNYSSWWPYFEWLPNSKFWSQRLALLHFELHLWQSGSVADTGSIDLIINFNLKYSLQNFQGVAPPKIWWQQFYFAANIFFCGCHFFSSTTNYLQPSYFSFAADNFLFYNLFFRSTFLPATITEYNEYLNTFGYSNNSQWIYSYSKIFGLQ